MVLARPLRVLRALLSRLEQCLTEAAKPPEARTDSLSDTLVSSLSAPKRDSRREQGGGADG